MHAFSVNFRPDFGPGFGRIEPFYVEIAIIFLNCLCFAQDSTRSYITPPIEGLRMFRGLNEFVRTVVDNL